MKEMSTDKAPPDAGVVVAVAVEDMHPDLTYDIAGNGECHKCKRPVIYSHQAEAAMGYMKVKFSCTQCSLDDLVEQEMRGHATEALPGAEESAKTGCTKQELENYEHNTQFMDEMLERIRGLDNPGVKYSGFVVTYASFLGLDPDKELNRPHRKERVTQLLTEALR